MVKFSKLLDKLLVLSFSLTMLVLQLCITMLFTRMDKVESKLVSDLTKLKWKSVTIASTFSDKKSLLNVNDLKNSDLYWKLKAPEKINCQKEMNIAFYNINGTQSIETCIEKSSKQFNVLYYADFHNMIRFEDHASYYKSKDTLKQCLYSKHDSTEFCYNVGTIKNFNGLTVKLFYSNQSYAGHEIAVHILTEVCKELNLTLDLVLRNEEWGNTPLNGRWENPTSFRGTFVMG